MVGPAGVGATGVEAAWNRTRSNTVLFNDAAPLHWIRC
jgi:hypothetical protein